MCAGDLTIAITGILDFAELVSEHQAMVFGLAYHFFHNYSLAEEVAQDVFLELHLHLRELKSPEHATWWLRRVAVNRCLDEARRRRRCPEIPLDQEHESIPCSKSRDFLLTKRLQRLVASLPEKARMVVLLRYQEDLDVEEIAELLNSPVNTIKSQLQRAVAMLRQKAGPIYREK